MHRRNHLLKPRNWKAMIHSFLSFLWATFTDLARFVIRNFEATCYFGIWQDISASHFGRHLQINKYIRHTYEEEIKKSGKHGKFDHWNKIITLEYVSTLTSTVVFPLLYRVFISPTKIWSFFKPFAASPWNIKDYKNDYSWQQSGNGRKGKKHTLFSISNQSIRQNIYEPQHPLGFNFLDKIW